MGARGIPWWDKGNYGGTVERALKTAFWLPHTGEPCRQSLGPLPLFFWFRSRIGSGGKWQGQKWREASPCGTHRNGRWGLNLWKRYSWLQGWHIGTPSSRRFLLSPSTVVFLLVEHFCFVWQNPQEPSYWPSSLVVCVNCLKAIFYTHMHI